MRKQKDLNRQTRSVYAEHKKDSIPGDNLERFETFKRSLTSVRVSYLVFSRMIALNQRLRKIIDSINIRTKLVLRKLRGGERGGGGGENREVTKNSGC